jgi:3-deoxy-manno-octulosonate cytidylyltransferase (CMP-KDO synthetase)
MKRALGVIPARYASTRFPGKILAPLGGKPLVEHVWRRAVLADRLDRVVVATDDDRIAAACRTFGAEVARTRSEHPSGTDRVAEVAATLGDLFDVVLNVQGDEPFVSPASLDRLVEAFDGDDPPEMATLVEPVRSADDLFDPNHVKVVADVRGRALYFSRSPIPFHRGAATRLEADFRPGLAARPGGLAGYWKHQGIYAYRPDALVMLAGMAPAALELDEGLEQLRALAAGFTIRVVPSDYLSVTVDTPADLEKAAAQLALLEAPS